MSEYLETGAARCEILTGSTVGRISDFACEDRQDGIELIAQALERLKAAGCTSVLAPIGQDTWGTYRLVVETDGTPVFPGEPDNPLFYVECFTANCFAPVANYVSTIDTAPEPAIRKRPENLLIEEWGQNQHPTDLERICTIANAAFAKAPFFEPIGFEQFSAIYTPLLASLPPRYCLIARNRATGEIVSCLLGYPSAAGLVLKTLMAAQSGAGAALVDEFYDRAVEDGATAVIHALMHDDNVSTRMSANRNGRVFRRYALFGRDL